MHGTPPRHHIMPDRVHTQCCIVNLCNIFHFHHSLSVENANTIFLQFFSFLHVDIPVSQNHVFSACSFSTLYLTEISPKELVYVSFDLYFYQKHVLGPFDWECYNIFQNNFSVSITVPLLHWQMELFFTHSKNNPNVLKECHC